MNALRARLTYANLMSLPGVGVAAAGRVQLFGPGRCRRRRGPAMAGPPRRVANSGDCQKRVTAPTLKEPQDPAAIITQQTSRRDTAGAGDG